MYRLHVFEDESWREVGEVSLPFGPPNPSPPFRGELIHHSDLTLATCQEPCKEYLVDSILAGRTERFRLTSPNGDNREFSAFVKSGPHSTPGTAEERVSLCITGGVLAISPPENRRTTAPDN